GFGNATGAIETRGDVDVFRFVAPQSGPVRVQLISPPESKLFGDLTLHDAALTELGQADASFNMLPQIRFEATQGATYYLTASASALAGASFTDRATGAYLLTLSFNDPGTDFATAQEIHLAADGTASQVGALGAPGEVNFFRFVAPLTGRLTV